MKVKELIEKLQEQDQDLEVMSRKINKIGYEKNYKPVQFLKKCQDGGFFFIGIDAQEIAIPKPRFQVKDNDVKTVTVNS